MELFPFLGMVHVTRADADLLNQFQSHKTLLDNTLDSAWFLWSSGRKTPTSIVRGFYHRKLSDADFPLER